MAKITRVGATSYTVFNVLSNQIAGYDFTVESAIQAIDFLNARDGTDNWTFVMTDSTLPRVSFLSLIAERDTIPVTSPVRFRVIPGGKQ